jgi:hypothetical protein
LNDGTAAPLINEATIREIDLGYDFDKDGTIENTMGVDLNGDGDTNDNYNEDQDGDGGIDTCFNFNRKDIFHYVILVHDCWAPRGGVWTLNRAGRGEGGAGTGGDDFLVTHRATKRQNTFMHELGHNIGLGHTNGQANERDSVMYTPSANANRLDYFPNQWSALLLDEVANDPD